MDYREGTGLVVASTRARELSKRDGILDNLFPNSAGLAGLGIMHLYISVHRGKALPHVALAKWVLETK